MAVCEVLGFGGRLRGGRGRALRWGAGVALGALWWWAALRTAVAPEEAGVVEGAVMAGGWGLSLLPVHCVPWSPRKDSRGRGGSSRPGVAGTGIPAADPGSPSAGTARDDRATTA